MTFIDPEEGGPMVTSVPVIVTISLAQGGGFVYYGPFANFLEARDWCDSQPNYIPFMISPLHRTDKIRSHNDFFFDPDREQLDDYYSEKVEVNAS